MEKQQTQNSQHNIEEEESWQMMLPIFKTFYKSAVINTVWYWQRSGQIDQQNRIESPEKDPHKYRQLIFDKGTNVIQWNKDSLLKNGAETSGHTEAKK